MTDHSDMTKSAIDALDKIADNAHLKTDEEIDRLIKETEETLTALMGELKRRQADTQHKDIDNLEDHLAQADVSFKALRNFIALALKEIRNEKTSF